MSQQPGNGPAGPGRVPGSAAEPALEQIPPLVELGPLNKPQTASRGPFAEVRGYRDKVRHVWWPNGEVTGGKRRSRPPMARQLVDVGEHQSTLTVELPARGGALHFAAVVQLVWQVTDPLRVVDLGLVDVAAALEPALVRRLGRITADFAIDQPAAANQRVDDWLDSEQGLQVGADRGLQVHAYARLRPNVDVETAIGEGAVAGIRNTQLQEQVSVVTGLIAAGDMSQAAFVMAQDPNQIPVVMSEIWNRQTANKSQTFDFLTEMIRSGVVERHQISDKIEGVLRWMEGATDTVMFDAPRELPALESGYRRGPATRPAAADDEEDWGWDDPPPRQERNRGQGRPRRPRRAEVVVEVVPDSEVEIEDDDEKPDENIRAEYRDAAEEYERRERPERSDRFDRPVRTSEREREREPEPQPDSWSGQFDDWGDDA